MVANVARKPRQCQSATATRGELVTRHPARPCQQRTEGTYQQHDGCAQDPSVQVEARGLFPRGSSSRSASAWRKTTASSGLTTSANRTSRGELDIAAAPALREQLSEVVTQGWIDIAIDIAELRYIDWPGLSVLVMTQKAVEKGGSLVVRHPTKAALKLFDTTGRTARFISTGRANNLIRF